MLMWGIGDIGDEREGVEAAFEEHADAFCGKQAQETGPGEGAGRDEGMYLCGSRVRVRGCEHG